MRLPGDRPSEEEFARMLRVDVGIVEDDIVVVAASDAHLAGMRAALHPVAREHFLLARKDFDPQRSAVI